MCFFVFFKQKTAYEVRISDWSSDVCSSDLGPAQAAPQGTPVTEEDAYAIGLEAYTYAYPMVLMEMTRRVSTNAGEGRLHAPMNHFSHMKTYPDASFRDVVRPNADTLYSNLWFDVGKEPLILPLPDTAARDRKSVGSGKGVTV